MATIEHTAVPADPADRRDAPSVTLDDWRALWYARVLQEYAHYGDHNRKECGAIADDYAERIYNAIHERNDSMVTLYCHTNAACEAMIDALLQYGDGHVNGDEIEDQITSLITDA